MPISSHCFWPWLRLPASAVAEIAPSRIVSRISSMRARSSALGAMEERGEDAALALQRQLEIVPDGVALEDRRLLEFSADAELGDLRLVVPGQVDAALEIDVAGVRPRLAGDDVHHRRLAGAVRADDGAHLARLDDERQAVQRLEAVEGDGDAVEIEERSRPRSIGRYSAVRADASAAGCGEAGGAGLRLCGGSAAAASAPPAPRAAEPAALRASAVQPCASVPTMPLRQEQRDDDEQPAEHEQPASGSARGEPALGAVDEDGADDRPDQRAAPADRDPDHHLDRIGRARTRRD